MKTIDNFSGQKIEKQNLAATKGGIVSTMDQLISAVWNATPPNGWTSWQNMGVNGCGNLRFAGKELWCDKMGDCAWFPLDDLEYCISCH